jgi:hypothetical protein
MKKIDYKKDLKTLYQPSVRQIEVVDVPAMDFLMVDGEGDPNTSRPYREAVEALFTVSYTLKFMVKKGSLQIDYAVFPLEGLWWADDPSYFMTGNKDKWKWTSMIAQPEFVTIDMVSSSIGSARKKKGLAALDLVRFGSFAEGKAAQIMYVGPYAEEGPTIARVHAFIEGKGALISGKHHEIYLGDPRRTSPDKLKTIIRQPFRDRV